MCIRDRYMCLAEKSSGMAGVMAKKPVNLSYEEAAAVSFGAVSYTHLRAHETVLDLVCRLLLEKQT